MDVVEVLGRHIAVVRNESLAIGEFQAALGRGHPPAVTCAVRAKGDGLNLTRRLTLVR